MNILRLTKTHYSYDMIIGENKIDITRNQGLIQVFYSIIQTNELKIENQNNNFSSNIDYYR